MATAHTRWLVRRAAAMAVVTLFALLAVEAIADSPEVAEISEPAVGAAPLNPEDVHMVASFADADGDAHLCSDWAIWTLAPAEPVWQADCAGGQEKVHIHLGDGQFSGALAGHTALEHDTGYELRVRFRDDSGDPEQEWSEWQTRAFTTASPGAQGNEAVAWAARPGYRVDVFASGLQLPVALAMVPEPDPHPSDPLLYVAELYGTIKVVARDGSLRDYASGLLNFNPTGNFPGSGETGIGGLAVDPASGDVFASLVYEDLPTGKHYPKVIRLESDSRGLAATGETTVLDMNGETQGASHQVSNLTISPAGELFVHNGDGGNPATARNLDSFRGKVLRMALGGQPLVDNPFYDAGDGLSARDYVWAAGFRNPFGGAWRLADGFHYEVENGPVTDRLARVVPGTDYMWEGKDTAMAFGAAHTWNPSHAPVDLDFIEPGRFGGSGFPAQSMGNAFVTESGSTYATGPQERGKRVVEIGLDADGKRTSGPTTLVEYVGTGKATAAGIAAGADGLYFTDLYLDQGYTSPIDPGANLLRISYCGASCIEPPTASTGDSRQPAGASGAKLSGPRIERFRLWRSRFAVGPAKGRSSSGVSKPAGTTFVYSLTEPAKVRIEIRSRATGSQLVLVAPGKAGGNRRAFSGRAGSRKLAPGGYVATVAALDAAGQVSDRASARFRIVGAARD